MNIFFLDTNIYDCTRAACDKHIVKMITEYAQLLSGALIELGFEAPYKMTHRNHPCAKWTRESYGNFRYLFDLVCQYHVEYTLRYDRNKIHAAWDKIYDAVRHIGFPQIRERFRQLGLGIDLTTPPCVVPEQYKVYSDEDELVQTPEDVVQSYRNYYIGDKLRFVTYKNVDPPDWIREDLEIRDF